MFSFARIIRFVILGLIGLFVAISFYLLIIYSISRNLDEQGYLLSWGTGTDSISFLDFFWWI